MAQASCFGTSTTPTRLLAVAVPLLRGELARRRARTATRIAALREAAAAEDKLNYNEPADWPLPVRSYLGAALLEAGDAADAATAYRQDLQKYPEATAGRLYGLAQAQRRDWATRPAAADSERRLAAAWQWADTPLQRASALVPTSVREFAEHAVDVAIPRAVEQRELAFGRRLVGFGEFDQRLEEHASSAPLLVAARAALQAVRRRSSALRARARARCRRGTAASARASARRRAAHCARPCVKSLTRSQAASSDASSYSRPTQNAGSAHRRFHGPPSAPRISRYFFSRTSGKAVVMWSAQSFSVGSAPGSAGELAVHEVAERLAGEHRCIRRRDR